MSMSTRSTGVTEVSEINITPMIDVLLVLLVIFIVVQMNMQRAFDLQLPRDRAEAPVTGQIVLEIEPGRLMVNKREVLPGDLGGFLREVFARRPDRILFVKAAPDILYGDVIYYIDIARGAGVTVVGAVLAAK
ncbi:MAG: biopolymer transporter ExbD [Gemmatimonadota bacterium]